MRDVAAKPEMTRASRTREFQPRYILAFEGYRTEVDYFRCVAENRHIVGASSPMDITVLQREEVDAGCSDPVAIVEAVKRNIDAMAQGCHTVDTVCEIARNSAWTVAGITRADPMMAIIDAELRERLGTVADHNGAISSTEKAQEICESAIRDVTGKDVDFSLPEPPEFIPGLDSVCIIIDRDRDSHSARSIDKFVSGCRKYGFRPFITNPCFEFWLMLHFEESIAVDRDMLLKNEMTDGKRFTETELDRIVNGVNPEHRYSKDSMDPFMFIHRIGLAVENSRMYCTDVKCLKGNVGTNLGLLYEDMMGVGGHRFF